VGDGLDGVLGVEKLRLPRLPDEPPPPALAHAVDSRAVEVMKHKEIKSPRATHKLFFVLMFGFTLVFKGTVFLRCPTS
jgi:hypothetical protein